MKRRNFVKTLASLAAVGSVTSVASAAGFGAELASDRPQGPAAGTPRILSAGHFGLQLNGVDVGLVHSVEGGNAVADVVLENTAGAFTNKRLGPIKYEPLRIKLPAVLQAEVAKVINDATSGGPGVVKSLGIVGYDHNFKIVSFREAVDAVLIEVGFEQLDATSKLPLHMVLSFQPTVVRAIDKGGEAGKVISAKTKAAIESNFKLSIDGVETTGVSSIKSILAKRSVAAAGVGGAKAMHVGGRFVASDLEVQVGMQHAQSFFEWFETFAINRSKPEERNGKIELLGPDLKAVLGTVSLGGVGISAMRIAPLDGNADRVQRALATIYVERLSFS